ncbi:hypothetical protein GCM10025771_30850 [Niveibacterium umoris]|uniref:Lcl C-terminal domain-containing protein n=1 Tax=Niveibacterium umoris TaxID=1193620 RepID=A0A840BGC4_9RHOO|nr:DUF1566 domain-containing protein [Niveibacterium umoris]MBB4011723.1 hypothetical protein [Niveibacterium umoris]
MKRVCSSVLGVSLAAAALLLTAATPAVAEERYTVSADGQEVVDNTAHLVWKRCVEGMAWDGQKCAGKPVLFKLPAAKAQAASEAKASGKEWRLPTRDELVALVVKNKKKPMIDQALFPNTPPTQTWASRPGFDDNLNAWLVHFGNGRVFGNSGERKFGLRLVRSNF